MNFYEKILFVFTNDVFLCLAELAANAERIQSVLSMGQNLIERKKCAGSEDAVHQRIESISEQWEVLSQKTTEKSMRLKEANRQRTFIAAVKVIAYKYFNFTNFFPRFIGNLFISRTFYIANLGFGFLAWRSRVLVEY